MLEQKNTYTINDLFDNLPINLRDLSKQSDINEATLARIRDGKTAYRSTVNKLLDTFSTIYDRPLGVHNVTELNMQSNKRLEKKGARPVGRPRKNSQGEPKTKSAA